MWCGFGRASATAAVICFVATNAIMSDTAFAVKKYTPRQFRAVLQGLGYKVNVSNAPLTDAETKAAIKEFQTGYKLKPADGVAGPKTEEFAAQIVEILQANLNLVLKPKSPLPRNQYYGSQTQLAVKQYQKKNQLPETGIADLALRQKLDKEAENLVSSPASTSTPTKKPSTKPKASPTPTPTASPEETSTPEATSTPTESPETTSTPTESPEATSSPSPTSTSKPSAKPTTKPRKK
ncbi:peptidoglycan-binding protein [Aetokthonos hydrillicola Thurmond2011]|jgi:peptidoglycan hydrolase-like protein with peptidoglycan-binding domain|uniref:Peptidoglycan-binding protein n=1 Tax=Aetokthonos hydrillicola Thurmond2011 TaxID=2712845 RepID=A0AAP5I497_9CYAN|nr:peptidoglycan-binding protein [Aetokthonos hydrillicola]MBO3460828.1 peptidoglycan-binding protein [Aetokthonos hydrillicola CCALA 1050]MBW4585621.1 peptidoglycan-binding protein [Aetokthonos hydrillicola CCALA 1050]MDR9894521.1 peptidoglycan-binding protein [Aetokthonos hydrillicola Thurmond2011]